MLGLVVPHAHPQPRADAAADRRHSQQHALRNPPPRPLRLPLVDAVEEEGEDVDDEEVEDEKSDIVTYHSEPYYLVCQYDKNFCHLRRLGQLHPEKQTPARKQ